MARGTSDGKMVNRAYEKPKPTFSVDEKDLPQIKKWDVGKKYKLQIEVEMVSHSKGDAYGLGEDKKKHEARLRIVSFAETGKE